MTVEPITVWAALVGMFVGMFVGALVVLSEWQRARLRWLEAMQTRQDEVKAVAEKLRGAQNKLPRHNGGSDPWGCDRAAEKTERIAGPSKLAASFLRALSSSTDQGGIGPSGVSP
jgi:hypothetical protein